MSVGNQVIYKRESLISSKKITGYILLLTLLLSSCSVKYSKKIKNTEDYFFQGKYEDSVNEIRELTRDADAKDRLLYLMEAGIILHSIGEYKKSNIAFKDADNIAETIKTSISKQAAAFLLNDTKANFKGENFERVLIKFYIALNYIMMENLQSAKRYFRKLDFELKEMKYEDAKYKQNTAARYLDGVVSESMGNYNDARIQYKNILSIDPDNKNGLSAGYILARKESDPGDMEKFKKGEQFVTAFNTNMEPTAYHLKMGELIIVHQAGKAAVKASRGRLLDDEEFMVALRIAIEVALRARGAGLTVTGVLASMGTSENPIPVYRPRDRIGAGEVEILINGKSAGRTEVMNNYTQIAIRNFNDNYSGMIAKNVASSATKIVIASIAAHEMSKKMEEKSGSGACIGRVLRFLVGAGVGKVVGATIEPDLRCWRLLPSNYQIKRIFLEPGKYKLSFNFNNNNTVTTDIPEDIEIKSGQPVIVTFRSMSVESGRGSDSK